MIVLLLQIKEKGQRRIDYDHFAAGMKEIAVKLFPASTGVKNPLTALVATDLRLLKYTQENWLPPEADLCRLFVCFSVQIGSSCCRFADLFP